LWKSVQMEPLVLQQRALMDSFDPDRRIGLIVDEWGTWHPPAPGQNPKFLWQQNTVRDALVAALTLDIFNRHADKVVMANIAQTINVLQALLLTDEHRMIKTPTYHVYDLYKAHQDGTAVRILVGSPEIACQVDAKSHTLPQLSGSASIKGSVLTVTLVNTSASEPVEARLRLHGAGRAVSAGAAALSYAPGEIRAHNTFDEPEIVTVNENVAGVIDSEFSTVQLAAGSVTRLTAHLA
jgi:alpha-N-arabinofuranosidase